MSCIDNQLRLVYVLVSLDTSLFPGCIPVGLQVSHLSSFIDIVTYLMDCCTTVLTFLGRYVRLCHRYIKMSSPQLNNFIVVGCVLIYVSEIMLGVEAILPMSVDFSPLNCSHFSS